MDIIFRATPDPELITDAVVKARRHQVRVLRLTLLALTAVFAVLAVLGPELFGFSGAAVTLVFSFVVPWFIRQGARSNARFIAVDTEYTVSPEGITSRTEHRDVTNRWPIFTDVVETPEMVLLLHGTGGGLAVIPVAGLDDATRERVLGLVRQRAATV